jgi:hypothetical protein
LAATVAAVLAVKAALSGGPSAAGFVVCALFCGLWLGFLAVAHRRIRALSESGQPTVLTPGHASAAVLCTVALAVCAMVLVF